MSEAKKNYPVITISRQYAAGGRSVTRKLAEILDIPWYDKDLMKKTAEESGYSVESILESGENVNRTTHFLANLMAPVMYESASDAIQKAQEEVVKKLAQEGPCIIVGRCANAILAKEGIPQISVFLYADLEHRLARCEELGENGDKDVKKYVAKRDNHRAGYYKTFTGHEQGDFRDYNICLDTGLISYEQAAQIIASLAEAAAEKNS